MPPSRGYCSSTGSDVFCYCNVCFCLCCHGLYMVISLPSRFSPFSSGTCTSSVVCAGISSDLPQFHTRCSQAVHKLSAYRVCALLFASGFHCVPVPLFPQVVYSADIRPATADIPGLWNPSGVSGIPVVYCFPVSAFYYSYDLYDLL